MSKIWLLISSLFLGPAEIPAPLITPGAVASTSLEEICGFEGGLSYSKRHRSNSYELRKEIRDRDHCDTHNSEVDHRVPLSVGGADTKENLWCQPGEGPWTFHDKDRLEVRAWEMLCKQHLILPSVAQKIFLEADWRIEYCQIWNTDPRCVR